MSTTSFLGFLLVCTLGVVAGDTEWCSNVTPPQGMEMNKMMGDWFFYKGVLSSMPESNPEDCHAIYIHKVDDTTISYEAPSAHMSFTRTIDPEKPWAWKKPAGGRMMMVVWSDGNKMVQTFCQPGGEATEYMIYVKHSPLTEEDMTEIEQHMDHSGNIRTIGGEGLHTWQSTATCLTQH